MEVLQSQAFTSQTIDVGSVDLAAVVADVGPAEVIGQQNHDVRSLGRRGRQCQEGERNEGRCA